MPVFVVRALAVLLCLASVSAWAQGQTGQGGYDFRVDDVRVTGVQRLGPGTVLTYLPLSVGDRLSEARAQQSIRALYETGLFENVALEREGNTLIVNVTERPEIARFSISGNKNIGGKDLKEALAQQGLAQGELYKRSLVDQLEQELQRQYYANGYYSVAINTGIEQLDNNRVAIDITVKEGKVASIKDINIIGNEHFADDELRDVFALQASSPAYTHPLTFWRSRDRYSREKLLGDLESLNSFYQNRGYIRFNVSSIQVSLSPDKRNIFLTINVDEGDQYTIDDYQFAGDMIVPQTSLQRLVSVEPGQIFSRGDVDASANSISSGLADFGYAFADVDPLTQVDEDNKTVDLTFFIDPGKRAYVRQITFNGNEKTNDETLRREMRQFEGAPFSRRGVERSRTRLARLPYIEAVQVSTDKVAGSEDLVDVDYDVSERAAGTLQFGVGFSDAQGFLINGSVSHSNFRGTGNRLSLRAETNDYAKSVGASWTDPYYTDEGVSRTISGFYRNTDQLTRIGSGFDLNSVGGAVTFGLPITEYSQIRAGLGVERNEINSAVNRNGEQRLSNELRDFIDDNGKEATTYELQTGWQRDTRNRSFFATRGSNTEFQFNIKGPGSDLEYYDTSLEHTRYFRVGSWVPGLSDKVVLSMDGRVAQTDIWGEGEDVPPYDNFFAGGARSVRGFSNGGLGPRDSFDNPYGGQFLTTLQSELVIPTFLESDNKSTRLTAFYDVGNVYENASDFEASELRKSAGVAFYWFTPFFGLLRVSYAAYVDDQGDDDTDRFQFSFGVGL